MRNITVDNQNITDIQISFFKSAVYDACQELNLRELLKNKHDYSIVSNTKNYNENATERLLNAATNLDILFKSDEGKYYYNTKCPVYTNEGALNLFWLINNKIPDLIENKTQIETIIYKYDESAIKKLDFFAKEKILSKNPGGNYLNINELKPFLLSKSSKYIGSIIAHYERVMFPMFSKKGLLGALKTGKSQWKEIFGQDVSSPFDLYKNESELLRVFTQGMHQLNHDDNKVLADNINLFKVKKILDIGGGSGAFSIQLLKKSSDIESIDIYELPDAIPLLKSVQEKFSPNEQKIQYIAGSFLNNTDNNCLEGLSEQKKYDMIIMGWILHDWNDDTSMAILRKAYKHLNQNGQLIILEGILPDNKVSHLNILDLAMLLQTEGKERTFIEYQNLVLKAGFNDITWIKSDTRRQLMLVRK
jgi:2-polyprenyl-3-methyl-5-hydroxy-6-metoxy-1,4-benzoquinol methylase